MADNRCDQCVAQGITLLPKRWGYEINKEDLTPKTYSRLVREGYIYILDNNNHWYGYVVNAGRYLESFNVHDPTDNPDMNKTDFVCHKGDNCKALKSFIRIPNPNQDIDTLWVAYSPVKWTKTIINNHQNNVDDAKTNNMVEVPVSATKSTSTASLGTAASQPAGGYNLVRFESEKDGKLRIRNHIVTEYLGYTNPFTEQPYQPDKTSEKSSLGSTLSAIEKNDEKDVNRVLSVFFNDPVGKLIDLNEFIVQFKSSKDNRYSETDLHKIDVALKIQNLEASIKSGVRSQEIDDYIAKKVEDKKYQYTKQVVAKDHLEIVDYDKKMALIQKVELAAIDRQEIQDKADLKAEEVWGDYLEKYKSTAMNKFMETDRVKRILDEKRRILDSLLSEHKLIFKSTDFTRQMSFNFDSQDIISGVSYLETVLKGIGVTVNYPECIERYANDLNTESLKDNNSHILRALAYNYQPVIDKIISESEKNIQWSSLAQAAWASIFNGGSAIYASNIIEKFIVSQNAISQLSAALTKALKEQANKPAISEATYVIGFHLQKEITRIEFYGRRHQAIKILTDLLNKQNTTASNSTINRFALSIINQLKVEGMANFEKGVRGHMLVLMDVKKAAHALNTLELPDAPTTQGKQNRINIINESAKRTVMSSNQVYDIGSDEFRRFIEPEKEWFSRSGKLAMAGGIFQTIACASLLHAAITGSESTQSNIVARTIENSEGWSKLAGGLGFLMGGILDRQANKLKLELADPTLAENKAKFKKAQLADFTKWAKNINIGSGAIFAFFDLYHAYDETTKANYGMMGLYIVSAAAGMGSVIGVGATSSLSVAGFSMSWNAVGWVLLGISIGVGIVISIFSNNPIQEWIENSIWGNDAIYKNNYEKDIKEYQDAVNKMAG